MLSARLAFSSAACALAAARGTAAVGSTRSIHWWLRDEHKKFERRAPLTPAQTAVLIADGHKVTVERSKTRIFADAEYEAVGCEMAETHSWPSAPKSAVVFALKELPDDGTPLKHTHVYFAHCFKGQSGAKRLLERFRAGGGKLFDLEFLHTPGTDVRVAAFGHMTGYAGAAMAVLVWAQQRLRPGVPLLNVKPYENESALIGDLQSAIRTVGRQPSIHVIGASGRCGSGVQRLCTELELKDVALWDRQHTQRGGPFPEAFQRDIFLNTIYLTTPIPPFITKEILRTPGATKTSVIVDISCDVTSKHNPLPIYDAITDFAAPTVRIPAAGRDLDLVAIDHLPAFLPRESSQRYAHDLFPYIRAFGIPKHALSTTWTRAEELFVSKKKEVLSS